MNNSIIKLYISRLIGALIIFVSFINVANSIDNQSTFNNTFSQHQRLISLEKYQEALPLAKQAYELSKSLFKASNKNRLVATDNYALNLQMTNNYSQAKVIFIELLSLYEQKYGKYAIELLPILTDLSSLNSKLGTTVDTDEFKAYEVRKYKLYLRHHSDDFVKQFSDLDLPTTIHAKNTVGKLNSHFDKEFSIYESDHWSIIYPPKRLKFVKNKMAKLMEQTYQNNISFLVSLGLRNKPIEEKMTAVYFDSHADYISYIKSITGDNYLSKASGGIYSLKARAMFVFGYANTKKGKQKRPKAHSVVNQVSSQVLYSTGYHSFSYVQPRWLKSGTSASFEYHDLKKSFGPHTNNYAFKRVLPVKKRYEAGSLITVKDLITFDGDEENFESSLNQSDIYALGSMLVRFLYAYYPEEFKDYLTILSKSRTTYYERAKHGKNLRLKQFKKAFGPPELMQEQFNVFIEKVIKETDIAYADYRAKKEAKKEVKRKAKQQAKKNS